MRIGYLSTKSTAAPLVTDMAVHIRRHRDRGVHRNIINAYRASHALCEWCLVQGHSQPTSQIHHMRPVAAGGPTSNENLLAVCVDCHRSVHTVPLDEQLRIKTLAGEIDDKGFIGGARTPTTHGDSIPPYPGPPACIGTIIGATSITRKE